MISILENKKLIKELLNNIYDIGNLKDNPYRKCLIYKNSEIEGILIYDDIYDRLELIYIYVFDEYRKNEVGTKLINYLINIMNKNKKENITLEVNVNNNKALSLYKKSGFKVCNIIPNYYNNNNEKSDGYLMKKEKDIYILAVESSCDETSMSIVKNGKEEIGTIVLTQMNTHALYGGVVPEIASRMHIENITIVLDELLNKTSMKMDDITAIAVTYAPGLIGSLLVGLEFAKTLSFIYNKPLVPVHHIAGHIYANSINNEMKFPLIALVVSGGHTDIIYMKDNYSFEKIGGTLDDAVGEAYDKVARVLKLPYPGGPKVDQLAHLGNDTYNLPIPLNDDTYNFSFSGIKSAVINVANNEKQRGNEININDLACSFQTRVVYIITKKILNALKSYNVDNLIVAGGVAANKGLREELIKRCSENNINLSIPDFKYCTDNATMIAAAGYYAYLRGDRADLSLNAKANEILK